MKFLFLIFALVASCTAAPSNKLTFDLPADDGESLPINISPILVDPLVPETPLVMSPVPLPGVIVPNLPIVIAPLPVDPLIPEVAVPEGPSTFPLIPEESEPAKITGPLIQIILNIARSSDVAVESPLLPWVETPLVEEKESELTRPWIEEPVVEEAEKINRPATALIR